MKRPTLRRRLYTLLLRAFVLFVIIFALVSFFSFWSVDEPRPGFRRRPRSGGLEAGFMGRSAPWYNRRDDGTTTMEW